MKQITKINNPNHIITFGKYKGNSIHYIISIDPKYIMWLNEKCNDIEIEKSIINTALYKIRERRLKNHSYEKQYTKLRKTRGFYVEDRERDSMFASCFDWGLQ